MFLQFISNLFIFFLVNYINLMMQIIRLQGSHIMYNEKPIQIFSNPEKNIGVNVVKSPVKLTILEMLRGSEMEFDEIVSNIGKSKSTVSVHLKSLRESGIVSFKVHPTDNRKKIFYLNSKYLGSVNLAEQKEIEETQKEYLVDNIVNGSGDFNVLLFHTLRSMLIQEGINIDPILQATGIRVGKSIFDSLYNDDLEVFLDNIAQFWQAKGLGKLSFELDNIIKITALDCFECQLLPKTGKPACFLDAGIFEALFTEYFNMPVSVIEIQCFTMGDGKCVFEVEPLPIDSN